VFQRLKAKVLTELLVIQLNVPQRDPDEVALELGIVNELISVNELVVDCPVVDEVLEFVGHLVLFDGLGVIAKHTLIHEVDFVSV
jgi:hypothetical protein